MFFERLCRSSSMRVVLVCNDSNQHGDAQKPVGLIQFLIFLRLKILLKLVTVNESCSPSQDLPANVERHVGTTFEKSRLGLQDLKDL
eukprot:6442942-Amphidinium_carterae.1